MQKVLVAVGLTVVGFIVVWRYQPGTAPQHGITPQPGPGSSTAPPPGATGTPGPSGAPNPAPGGQRTVSGSAVDTPYGTVQVQAVLSGGKLTDVTFLQAPSGGRSSRITRSAAPVLVSEALQAQNAQVDSVSGATYTSEAYTQSLQAALDAAGK